MRARQYGFRAPYSSRSPNPTLGGYEVEISEEQLKGAPKYSKHENWDWSDPERGRKVHIYDGEPPCWGS